MAKQTTAAPAAPQLFALEPQALPLRQKQTIRLPRTEIDNGTRDRITALLTERFAIEPPADSDAPDFWTWTTPRGTFPKRLAKYLRHTHDLKVDSNFLGTVGSLAGSATDATTYTFDFTDRFDWRPGDFGDEGSCFWTCNASARARMEAAGYLALRFYDDAGNGIARSWLAPQPDGGFVLFNAYNHNDGGYRGHHRRSTHGLTTLPQARILAAIIGGTYKKIDLTNYGDTSGTLWINSGIGYLVASPEQIKHAPAAVDLRCGPRPDARLCRDCDSEVSGDDAYTYDGYTYCERCFDERYGYCDACSETYRHDDLTTIDDRSYCSYCRDDRYFCCDHCDEWTRNDDRYSPDGSYDSYCEECYHDRYGICHHCDQDTDRDDLREYDGWSYCTDCFNRLFATCCGCDTVYPDDETTSDDAGDVYCDACYCARYRTCAACAEELDHADAVDGPDGEPYCAHCHADLFATCETCGTAFAYTARHLTDDGRAYCDPCQREALPCAS